MQDYVKYATARNQLYDLVVKIRALDASIPAKHRTSELVQVLEMVDLVVRESLAAFEGSQVLAMQLDRYEIHPLPGFEDIMADTENPYRGDTG
jgi:hypothetical protein